MGFQNFRLSHLRACAHVEAHQYFVRRNLPSHGRKESEGGILGARKFLCITVARSKNQQVVRERSGFAPMLLYEFCPRPQQQRHNGHRERASLWDAASVVVVTDSNVAVHKVMNDKAFQELLMWN